MVKKTHNTTYLYTNPNWIQIDQNAPCQWQNQPMRNRHFHLEQKNIFGHSPDIEENWQMEHWLLNLCRKFQKKKTHFWSKLTSFEQIKCWKESDNSHKMAGDYSERDDEKMCKVGCAFQIVTVAIDAPPMRSGRHTPLYFRLGSATLDQWLTLRWTTHHKLGFEWGR